MATVASAPAAAAARSPFRRLLAPGIATLIGVIILCGLGTWQLQRLAWKEDLIARVETRTHLPPVAAPGPQAWPGLDLDAADYLPVTVKGRYDNDREVHVFAALTESHGPLGGQGYFVMVPFVTDAGWTVIVNRGFVPEAFKDPATRAEGRIDGETEVTGLLRPPQGRNWFTPADDTARNMWFTRDPATIGAFLQVPPASLAPYTIDARYDPALPGGLPQGGETTVTFPNNHLQYVITWFGLAAALIGVFAAFARATLRKGRAEASAPHL